MIDVGVSLSHKAFEWRRAIGTRIRSTIDLLDVPIENFAFASIFMKIVLPVGRILVTVSVALGILGCGGAEVDTRPRLAVSGEVTLDGTPLAQGQITFDPKSRTDGVPAFGKIDGGHFSVDQVAGPVPGSYFIRIEAIDSATAHVVAARKPGEPKRFDPPSPKSLIPPQYNTDTELGAEVKVDAPNAYKFELSSKVDSKHAARVRQIAKRRR
jgi:hypothetical protein